MTNWTYIYIYSGGVGGHKGRCEMTMYHRYGEHIVQIQNGF